MRLTELRPQWIDLPGNSTGDMIAVGVMFRCPTCRKARISVMFANPIDPQGCLSASSWKPGMKFIHGPQWQRSGETFDTLTLAPSIDRSGDGHWHGHVASGEVSTNAAGTCAATTGGGGR